MFEKKSVAWLGQILIYVLLAVFSTVFATQSIYILVWLPAGWSIYLMIRDHSKESLIVFVGGGLSYGVFMLLRRGGLPPFFPLVLGMLAFGVAELINGSVGKIVYGHLSDKISNSGGSRRLVAFFQAVVLPSLITGFILVFVRMSPRDMTMRLIGTQWLSGTMSYFLGSSLVLPFFYYYHREKTSLKSMLRLEVRWTALVILVITLYIGGYIWPKAIIVSILMGLILVPHINATLGSGLVIMICIGMANGVVHTTAIWSQATILGVYGELFLKIVTVLWGMHLIIGILQDRNIVVATLEEVIEDRTTKLGLCLERVDELIAFDQLTGMLNRKAFMERGILELQRIQRYKRDLTLMHIDIDGLKAINDLHGYEQGDAIIVAISRICEDNLRTSDIIARIAGDEFGVLMPETTELDASFVAEKIRSAVMNEVLDEDRKINTTVSVGITGCIGDIEQCMVSADTALYRAKKAGRNNVTLSSGQ